MWIFFDILHLQSVNALCVHYQSVWCQTDVSWFSPSNIQGIQVYILKIKGAWYMPLKLSLYDVNTEMCISIKIKWPLNPIKYKTFYTCYILIKIIVK